MYIIERCNICYCNDTLSVYHNLFRRDSKLDIPQKMTLLEIIEILLNLV